MTVLTPLVLIAAGGIGRPGDVRDLAALLPRLEGAVVGRALYEGGDLAAFLEAAAPQ